MLVLLPFVVAVIVEALPLVTELQDFRHRPSIPAPHRCAWLGIDSIDVHGARKFEIWWAFACSRDGSCKFTGPKQGRSTLLWRAFVQFLQEKYLQPQMGTVGSPEK